MRTTISLHVNTIKKIVQLSEKSGQLKREIIAKCLNIIFLNHKNQKESLGGGLVHYQKRDPSCYKRVHYTFDELSYKLAIDCRNLYRASISSMIADIIDEWETKKLKLDEGKEVLTKYFSSFIIKKYQEEHSVIWHYEWGSEQKDEATIYLAAGYSDP